MRRLLVLTALAAALTAGAQQRIVRLWNNASAPHDNGLRGGERVEEDRLFNTTEAVLYVYAADPARATGQAAVGCPGGKPLPALCKEQGKKPQQCPLDLQLVAGELGAVGIFHLPQAGGGLQIA